MGTASSQPLDALDRPLVAHAIYRLDVGGMENGLINLINGLPSDRYRHAVICVTTSSEFEKRLTAKNVDIYELHKREGKDPRFYFRFWKLMRKLKPAVLHTRNLGTLDLAPMALLARVPVRIHGEHGWHAADPFGRSRKYRILRRLCDRAISRYVAVSKDIENWLHNVVGVDAGRVRQIYNGVDVDKFHPDGASVELPFDRPRDSLVVVGTIGRMDRIKNFNLLITAVARLVEENSGYRDRLRLILVGDGSQMADLRNLTDKLGLGNIAWLPGEREDIDELLRSMHLFVLPSLNEGISNTILEAMSSGVPVIATDVGGNPELVVNNDTGTLIAADDTDAIVAAIKRYLCDSALFDAHGRAARDRALSLFSLQAMVQSYRELYDELLGADSPSRIH